MKEVKRYNLILLLLMGLGGIAIGTAIVMLILSLNDNRSIFPIIGLSAAILAAILMALLPYVTYRRDEAIARYKLVLAQFGKEVSFLSKKDFFKEIESRRAASRLYALHVEMPFSLSEKNRREAGHAIADAVESTLSQEAIIGYDEKDEFFFFTLIRERDFVNRFKKIQDILDANPNLPTLTLLLGASSSKEEGYEKMEEEAVIAASFASERRDSLSLQIYSESDIEKEFDVKKAEEQGRFSYFVLPFGEGEEKVALLSPNLYDPFRGDMVGKDLLHAISLFHARKDLDEACLSRAVKYLESGAEGSIVVRIGEDSLQNSLLLSEISQKLDEKGIDKKRLIIAYFALDLGKRTLKDSIRKAKGLGFRIAVYEYGGEAVENLIGAGFSYAFMKPELLRATADPDYLANLTNVLYTLNIFPLIEQGKLGEGLSALPCGEAFRLPDDEEEEGEEKKEGEAE